MTAVSVDRWTRWPHLPRTTTYPFQYMGDAPVLPFTIDYGRYVETYCTFYSARDTDDPGKIGRIKDYEKRVIDTPPYLTDPQLQRSLRWVIAVAQCPYCGHGHEHYMSQTAMWGWYTSPCSKPKGYYFVNDIEALSV